jgi:hydroxypyruvate reductase
MITGEGPRSQGRGSAVPEISGSDTVYFWVVQISGIATLRGTGARRAVRRIRLFTIELGGMADVHAWRRIPTHRRSKIASGSPEELARAMAAGIDARKLLDTNDSYGFFKSLGDLVVTGPTLTNVNDYRAILIA